MRKKFVIHFKFIHISKGQVVPVYEMKAYEGSGRLALLILNLGISGK
jgi:hypothetical protein